MLGDLIHSRKGNSLFLLGKSVKIRKNILVLIKNMKLKFYLNLKQTRAIFSGLWQSQFLANTRGWPKMSWSLSLGNINGNTQRIHQRQYKGNHCFSIH